MSKRPRDSDPGVEIARLSVNPARSYGGAFPVFKQPKEVAVFSRDADRAVTFDRRALRSYREPRLPASLDDGFEQYVPKSAAEEEPAPLGDVLGALAHSKVDVQSYHFVTFRNNLNKIMLTPYNAKDDWEIGAQRVGNSIHLHVRDTARKAAEEANRDERQQRMCYWGYRFEQLSTGDASGSGGGGGNGGGGGYRVASPSDLSACPGLWSEPEMERLRTAYAALQPAPAAAAGGGAGAVNANEEFCAVLSLGLAGVRLLMAAEIDCAHKGSDGREAYVELKTSRQLSNPHQQASFEKHKLLKFWVQSFLAGVPRIVVGFRDDAGVVGSLQSVETMKIPRMVRGKEDMWDPAACLNFGKAVLEWLLQQMRQLPADASAVMRYEPAQGAVLLLRVEEGAGPTAKRAA